MNVGLIGCGLVGRKRAAALGQHKLIACADSRIEAAQRIAAEFGHCDFGDDPSEVLNHPEIQAVIVATSHDSLAELTRAALTAGKHVLVEKPAARRVAELQAVIALARDSKLVVKAGFNHRFHPAIRAARRIFDEGGVGELMYIRGRYGHGGRLGYEKEWRADPRISGGGELLDQGSHLIDLAHWFAGPIHKVSGQVGTFFWPMQVEDNAFIHLQTPEGKVAWLHASWSEWKNLFSFEIFGRDGKLQIDGLGGSYGPERLTHYKMLPQMGPPETTCWDFPEPDQSWAVEFEHFAGCIQSGEQPLGSLDDALVVLTVVERLYADAAG